MTEDAYFDMLEKSIDKYEYWDGVAVAMAGAQPDHATIEMNIGGELFQQLRGKNCIPRNSNQAVKLAGSKGYVFPDLTVICVKPEFVHIRGIGCLLNPTVIAEVLSPSTATLDETQKLLAYSALPSVREYLVVSSDRCMVKLYFRSSSEHPRRNLQRRRPPPRLIGFLRSQRPNFYLTLWLPKRSSKPTSETHKNLKDRPHRKARPPPHATTSSPAYTR